MQNELKIPNQEFEIGHEFNINDTVFSFVKNCGTLRGVVWRAIIIRNRDKFYIGYIWDIHEPDKKLLTLDIEKELCLEDGLYYSGEYEIK